MRSPLFALIKKDLKGYFDQPTGYILIVVFVALVSYWFFRSAFLAEEASLRPLFTVDFTIERPSLPWLLALFVPAATMRLLAEEQRDGTLEIILTQPIRGWIVLVSKFLSGFLFVAVAILATVGIPIALSFGGDLDWGAVIAQYVGTLFLAASFVSIGLLTSSLTRNQIVAFILALTFSAILMFVGMDVVGESLPTRVAGLLQALSPVTHFSTIARGLIDLRDVLYFVALIFTFLSASFLAIRSKTLSHQTTQYLNLRLGVAGLIVFSLLVGWFGSSIGGRLDLTEDKIYTLSPGSADILSSLDDLLTIELFQSKDPPTQIALVTRDARDFLEDFAASSGGKVKIVHRFPVAEGSEDEQKDWEKAQLAGIPPQQFNVLGQTEVGIKLGYLGLAMTYIDRREVIPVISSVGGFEYRMASLAHKMLKRDRKTVAFLTGHGEKSKDQDFGLLASNLEQQFEVTEVAAVDGALPDLSDVDVLIIPGPTAAILPREREALHGYLASGGKMMLLVDPVVVDPQRFFAFPNPNNFADFAARYGVIVEDNLVFDVQANEPIRLQTRGGPLVLPYPYWAYVPTVDAKVAGDVGSVLMPWASSLGIADSKVGPVEVIPLLRTRPSAAVDYAYGDVAPNSPQLDLTDKVQFESDIGVAITGPAGGDRPDRQSFRLVVVGDSDFLTDPFEENIGLGLNLIDWLAQEEALASIRSKVVSSRELAFSSSTKKNVVQYANILGVPLGWVVLGLLLNLRRRGITMRSYRREE